MKHVSKRVEIRQKYSGTLRFFNSLLGAWQCGQTRSYGFNILHTALHLPKSEIL